MYQLFYEKRRILVLCMISIILFAGISELWAADDITGDWDSLVIAHFKDRKDLNKFIKKVLSMENIERTNTQVALNIVKDEKRLLN